MTNKTVNELTALSASPAVDDYVPIWDTSASAYKRITTANLLGGTMTGDGVLATGGFTLTAPATGTAALASGISGGQTFYGGAASGDDLTLESTSNDTKGYITLISALQSKAGMGYRAVKALSHNTETSIATATLPTGNKVASFLVTAVTYAEGRLATRTFVVDAAFSSIAIGNITTGALFSISTLVLTATISSGVITFKVLQTNSGSAAATAIVVIQPIFVWEASPLTFATV